MTDIHRAEHPLIGIRAWHHQLYSLTSLWTHFMDDNRFASYVWESGKNTATCDSAAELVPGPPSQERLVRHMAAPMAPYDRGHCQCGFNAYFELKDLQVYTMSLNPQALIFGIIQGWGASRIHEDGWRSEHAKIMALFSPLSDRYYSGVSEVAKAYNVPVVSPQGLPSILGEFGTPYTGPRPTMGPGGGATFITQANAQAVAQYIRGSVAWDITWDDSGRPTWDRN